MRKLRPSRDRIVALSVATAALALIAAARAADSEKDAKGATERVLADAKSDEKTIRAAFDRLRDAEPPKSVESLIALAITKNDRRLAVIAQASLSQTKEPRAARAVAKAIELSKDARERRLLVELAPALPGDEITRALEKALQSKDDPVRAAAATALGARKDAAKQLKSILGDMVKKDKSARVRVAAMAALEELGESWAKAPDPPTWRSDGTPSRFDAGRVAFVIDESDVARERDLDPPTAEAPAAPVGSQTPADKKAQKKAVSAFDIAALAVGSALVRLPDDGHMDVLCYASSIRSLGSRKWVAARGHSAEEAGSFLKPKDDGSRARDALRAIENALTMDPPPDELYVFTAGMPDSRDDAIAEAKKLGELAWAKGAKVHAIGLVLPERDAPTSEREKLDRKRSSGDFSSFLSALTGATAGRVFLIQLSKHEEPPAPTNAGAKPKSGDKGDKPGAAGANEKFAVKLDKNNKVTHEEIARVKKKFEDALKTKDSAASEVIEAVAACPEPSFYELVKRALESPDPPVVDAAIAGFANNANDEERKLLAQDLHQEKDPGKAMSMIRALAAQKGKEATRLLVLEADHREGAGDLARVLMTEIARRPAQEIAAVTSPDLTRAMKNRVGIAAREVDRIMANLKGTSLDDTPLVAASDRFLPEKFVKDSGVAIIVDVERDAMEKTFYEQPRLPAAQEKLRVRDDTPPVTRLEAARKEASRALEAIAVSEAKGNAILMGDGRAYQKKVALLPHLAREAREWITGIPTDSMRDPLRALEKAFDDNEVEVIYVLTAGVPSRASTSAEQAIRRVRELERVRRIPVHVVAVLGILPGGDDREAAAAERKDELHAIEEFWSPIAREAGGSFDVRVSLKGLDVKPPQKPAKPGK